MTNAIPPGRVSTYRSLGEHIDVMPRHVAYLLSTLDDIEREIVPWRRVVSDKGIVSAPNAAKATAQTERLKTEGVLVNDEKAVVDFDTAFIAAAGLASGVPKQRRPS